MQKVILRMEMAMQKVMVIRTVKGILKGLGILMQMVKWMVKLIRRYIPHELMLDRMKSSLSIF
jgi:hypothetical protein